MVSRYLQDNASILLYPVPSYLHISRQPMATWQTPLVIRQIAPIIYDYGIFGYHSCLILGMGDCDSINNDNHNHLYETESFHNPLAVRYTHTQAHTWISRHTRISRHTNKCSCSHVHSHMLKSTSWQKCLKYQHIRLFTLIMVLGKATKLCCLYSRKTAKHIFTNCTCTCRTT